MLTTGELDLMLPERARAAIRAELHLLAQYAGRLGKGKTRMWYHLYLLDLLTAYTPQPSGKGRPWKP